MIATKIQIRFADCDMAGHVHNAAYLHYFEQARMSYFFTQLKEKWDWKKTGFILKKNVVEYEKPTYLNDKISVEVKCNHIGTKSFTLSYKVISEKGDLKASGESIVVCFDYIKNSTINIPPVLLSILKAEAAQKEN